MPIDPAPHAEDVKQLNLMIHGNRIAMLTTTGSEWALRSRPMFTQEVDARGDRYFLTSADSALVGEILANAAVHLTYADPGSQRYVAINGTALVTHDQARIDEMWSPAAKAWFPDGKEDPQIRVLTVEPQRAEYWDAPSAPVRLLQFVKAMATGQQQRSGAHETLQL